MSAKSSCLLISGTIAIALVFITQTFSMATAKSIASFEQSTTSENSRIASEIFAIPNHIGDDDLLQEYGRYMNGIMNQTIDPCENFYEYACGNWKNSEMVPKELQNESLYSAIDKQLNKMLVGFLKNITDDELKTDSLESKAKIYYNSCLKSDTEMKGGFKQIWEMEKFNKNYLPSSDNETFDWININFLSPHRVYPLLPLDVEYDDDKKKYFFTIDPPLSIFSNSSIVDVKNLTRDFKIEDDELQKTFTKQLKDMIDFEKNLIAQVTARNKTESLALKDFLSQHKNDAFNWTRFFYVAFNGTEKPEPTVNYNIEDITPLVRFLNKTDLKTLRDYVKWKTLWKFYNIWNERTKDMSREALCLESTKNYFTVALMPWLIKNTISADRRADMLQIGKHVKETFYDLMDNYTWLDDETKSNAKTKLSAMDIFVGYTDDMRNRLSSLDDTEVNMTEDWIKNIFVLESKLSEVRMLTIQETELSPFIQSAYMMNSFYSPNQNAVYLGLGNAQLPAYHIKFPVSIKFSTIARVIGHEMGHGFDSHGYKNYYDGKKRNWWTESSLRNFKERYHCLEMQYSKYFYHGIPTNGTRTSPDDIADNAGIRLAYFAYMNNYGMEEGNQMPISGLNFTNRQLFFLKFAQNYCTGQDDAKNEDLVKFYDHSYGEFRVRGPLSNMPEFSEVFKCKLGTNMNPLKKCVLW